MAALLASKKADNNNAFTDMVTKVASSLEFMAGSAGLVVGYFAFVISKRSGFGQVNAIQLYL